MPCSSSHHQGYISQISPSLGPCSLQSTAASPGPKEATPSDAGSRAEGGGSGVDPSLLCTSLLISKDLVPHSLLLCSPEYDIEAAQEKDRQAFKPTAILQTQKTNCVAMLGSLRECAGTKTPG